MVFATQASQALSHWMNRSSTVLNSKVGLIYIIYAWILNIIYHSFNQHRHIIYINHILHIAYILYYIIYYMKLMKYIWYICRIYTNDFYDPQGRNIIPMLVCQALAWSCVFHVGSIERDRKILSHIFFWQFQSIGMMIDRISWKSLVSFVVMVRWHENSIE